MLCLLGGKEVSHHWEIQVAFHDPHTSGSGKCVHFSYALLCVVINVVVCVVVCVCCIVCAVCVLSMCVYQCLLFVYVCVCCV